MKSLPLGDSSELKVGQTVIAIGNPLGELTGTVTQGIISGLHRTVEVGGSFADPGVEKFEDAIQTDAAINSGNSGGPLIDLEGRVIGINFATVGGADNLSFALPINRVKSRISELISMESLDAFPGVEYRNRVTFFENKSLLAAEIITISENSPAQMANLKQGDMIVGYNGKSLEEKSLTEYIQSSNIGDEVTLNIIRDNQRVEIKAKIGTR
jgi:S1-C subfamily serine protease